MSSKYGKDVWLVAEVVTQTEETVYMDPNLQTFFWKLCWWHIGYFQHVQLCDLIHFYSLQCSPF